MAAVLPTPDERARKFSGPKFHGVTPAGLTRAMRSWTSMLLRCFAPGETAYLNYGGRGITVCERWFSFANFLSDMGERPEGLTLERVDNDGHYEPTNCAWATPGEQARNTRRNRRLTANGETMVQAEAARRAGVNDATIMRRLAKGHSVAEAVSGRRVKKMKLCAEDVDGIRALLAAGLRQAEIAARFGVSAQSISQIKLGRAWPL